MGAVSKETLNGAMVGGGGLLSTGGEAPVSMVKWLREVSLRTAGRGGMGGSFMSALRSATGTFTNPLQTTESLSGFFPVTAVTGICLACLTWVVAFFQIAFSPPNSVNDCVCERMIIGDELEDEMTLAKV